MENESGISELYTKFLNNSITLAEVDLLLLHFKIADEAALRELISLEFDREEQPAEVSVAEQVKMESILQSIRTSTYQDKSKFRVHWFYKIAVAAAILVIGSFGVILYNRSTLPIQNDLVKNDVAPGTNQAILTLANGNQIYLSNAKNGRLAKTKNASIAKTADGKLLYSAMQRKSDVLTYNTLTTPKGGQHLLQLSDGTMVWLNAASSLKFPETFNGSTPREVILKGEAYFEVAKSYTLLRGQRTRRSFIVKTEKQDVEVLGTHFNINAYENELAIKTTLLEGSVRVSLLDSLQIHTSSSILTPGEQAITTGNKIQVMKADLRAAIDWKNGDFTFKKGEDFRIAMRKLERWYNVEMVYDNSVSDKIDLGGWLSRKLSLSTVLERISSTGKVHFKIEGRRVLVTK